MSKITGNIESPDGWMGSSGNSQPLTGWIVFMDTKKMISPNTSLDGFILESDKLPKIVNYYIQGNRPFGKYYN